MTKYQTDYKKLLCNTIRAFEQTEKIYSSRASNKTEEYFRLHLNKIYAVLQLPSNQYSSILLDATVFTSSSKV